MKGFNVNDKYYPFSALILSGSKTVETRKTRSLDSLIGKRVGIIRTGKGSAMLVGYVDVVCVVEYNEESFRQDYDRHKVVPGSAYDIEKGGIKYGYVLENPIFCNPVKVSAKGIVIRNLESEVTQ